MVNTDRKYKIIACDMDGTLLNSEGKIPAENVEAVKRCSEEGVVFVLCTGRPAQAVENFRNELGLDTPVITYNGSRIVIPRTGEVLYQECLDYEDVCRVLDLVNEYNAVACVWADDKLYFNEMTPLAEHYVKVAGVTPVMYDASNKELFKGTNVNKLLWAHQKERTSEILLTLKEKVPESVSCFTSSPEYIEFVSCRVSKGSALKRLCEKLDIDINEAVAIGDGNNDIEMIKAAGLGVAMENATEDVKKAADTVTASNDEAGVSRVILEIVLGERRL